MFGKLLGNFTSPLLGKFIGVLERLFAHFNGLDQYAIMAPWTSTGVNFKIKFKVRFDDAAMGQTAVILGIETATFNIRKHSSDTMQVAFSDSTATLRVITSSVPIESNKTYSVEITCNGNGVGLSVNGTYQLNANVIDPAAFVVTSMMAEDAPGNFTAGQLWDVSFTDLSGIQDGSFPTGNGSDFYFQMPEQELNNFTLELDHSYSSTNLNRLFGNKDSGFNSRAYINPATETLVLCDRTGSTIITHYFDSLNEGQTIKVKVVKSGTSCTLTVDGKTLSGTSSSDPWLIGTIFRQYSSHGFGVTGKFSLTNDDTGEEYRYNLNDIIDLGNGYGLAPQTGNVEQYGEEYVTQNATSVWTGSESNYSQVDLSSEVIEDGWYHIIVDATEGTAGNIKVNFSADSDPDWVPAGTYYETVFNLTGSSAVAKVQTQLDTTRYVGSVTVSIRPTTAGLVHNYDPLTDLTYFPNNSRFYPMDDESNILRDELNEDGEELWDDGSVVLFGESSYASEVATILSSDGSDSGVKVVDALEIGEYYLVTLDVEIVSGSLRVGDAVGSDKVITSSGSYSFIFLTDSTTAMVKRNSGITDITVSNISYKETTAAEIQAYVHEEVWQ